jgi:UDPglucose 6-dehydrogenase
LAGRKIGVWGLAFKPNTDDIREAPALVVIDGLLEHGAEVSAFDPEAMDNVRVKLGDSISYASDLYAAIDQADALVICTEWNEFRRPDFELMAGRMAEPLIFDGRNLFKLHEVAEHGFAYYSTGRPAVTPPVTSEE